MAMQTGLGCPDCRDGGGIKQMLLCEQLGSSQVFCENGHTFNDTGKLMDRNPDKLPTIMKKTIQQGHETFQVTLPGAVVESLRKRFGTPERLVATLGGVLTALSKPKCFLLTEEEISNIEEITGQKINSASELKGLMWATKNEVRTKQAELDGVLQGVIPGQQTNGKDQSSGRYLDLAPVLPKLQSLAKFRGQKLEQINESVLKTVIDALENGWV